jgi:hypothetical protein
LANLQHFVSEFIAPLRTRAAMAEASRREESPGIDSRQLASVVGNMESIANFHAMFYKELKDEFDRCGGVINSGLSGALSPPPPLSITGAVKHPNLARIFLEYADFFKLYTAYLNGYEQCIQTMEDLKNSSKYQRFVREEFMKKPRRASAIFTNNAAMAAATAAATATPRAAAKSAPTPRAGGVPVIPTPRTSGAGSREGVLSPQMSALSLLSPQSSSASASPPAPNVLSPQPQAQQQLGPMDYIIQPVQRLPRYVLLLKELLRHTPVSDAAHHGPITHALARIEEIAAYVNERKRGAENMQTLLAISEAITGALPSDMHLIEPHRRLVRQGCLTLLRERALLGTVKATVARMYLFNDLLLYTNDATGKFKGLFDLNATLHVDTNPAGGGPAVSAAVAASAAMAAAANAGSLQFSAAIGEGDMFRLSDSNNSILCKCSCQ